MKRFFLLALMLLCNGCGLGTSTTDIPSQSVPGTGVSPPATLADAFNQELSAHGFNVGPGGASVKIELAGVYYDTRFFAGGAVADVSFKVIINGPDGRTDLNKVYQGDGTDESVVYQRAVRAALIKAHAAAFKRMFLDPDFKQALIVAGGQPKPLPAVGS